MLDHVSIPASDLERSAAFYDAVLGALGLVRRKTVPSGVGYGPPGRAAPTFWLLRASAQGGARAGPGLHLSFEAPRADAVDAFFAAALAHGGRSAGEPGPRAEYTQPFYGAFVLDPDDFKIEAVCRTGA